MPSVTDLLGTSLVRLSSDASSLEKVNDLSFLEGKKVLLYFSAHWCPPCRMFTPKLVEMVNTLKEEGNEDKFVVVFISSDQDEQSMFEYMKEENMPWFALPFGDKRGLNTKHNVTGIPTVILLDSNMERIEKCPLRGDIDGIKNCLLE
ncbi:hypothetical protein ABK040_015391 [Willaertia magna]